MAGATEIPSLTLPPGKETIEVHIINTTSDLVCPAPGFISPVLPGQETINMPTFSFLLRHPTLHKTFLFDLGVRKDWWNYAPKTAASMKKGCAAINVPKNINEILKEGGMDGREIDGVILSHWHFDHCGDISLFGERTEMVVGPGFKDAMMPGYPKNPESPMLETDFAGRTVREISFSPSQKLGAFQSHDFFSDGSLYLLSTPGHAIGHLSALVRTTPTTFILLGGDICHFGGVYRPTSLNPLPDPIPESVPLDANHFSKPCPCAVFTACHRDQENSRTTPFYDVTKRTDGFYVDPKEAQRSVEGLKAFDAHKDVFVAISHDEGLLYVCGYWPDSQEGLNGWKEKGWKEAGMWEFLNALPIEGKPTRPWICEGFSGAGRRVDL